MRTLGSSSAGALVMDLSFAGLRDLGLGYSLVPLDASDLESSCIAAVRWRGGAIVNGFGDPCGVRGCDGRELVNGWDRVKI